MADSFRAFTLGVFSAAILAAGAPAAAASLVGSSMDVSYRFPDVATAYPFATATPPTFVVGAGIESTVDVEGVTFIDVDFGADTLTITFNTILGSPTWNPVAFNGLLFEGAGAALISGATVVATTMAGFDDSRIYLSGGDFGLNWGGLSYVDGTSITLALGVVPEPASWAMLITGFGLVGAASRRRRQASVA